MQAVLIIILLFIITVKWMPRRKTAIVHVQNALDYLFMPQNYNYSAVMPLVSTPRMASFQSTFQTQSDSELYGVYVWAQHVVGALYPITQNVEISLRNAVDKEARARLGDFWWKRPAFNSVQTNDFRANLQKAESSLTKHWKRQERIRLRLAPNAPVPTPVPVWSHDQILASTDFSTWEYVLRDDFKSPQQAKNGLYLWPNSMSKVFKKYSLINTNVDTARKGLYDLVHEIRNYRNRLFHHDKIWIVDPTVTDARTAIDTIRHKINRMELLIHAIEPKKKIIMEKVGIFSCARRVCSVNDLDIYRYTYQAPNFATEERDVLRGLAAPAAANNVTTAWHDSDTVYGIYRIR